MNADPHLQPAYVQRQIHFIYFTYFTLLRQTLYRKFAIMLKWGTHGTGLGGEYKELQ